MDNEIYKNTPLKYQTPTIDKSILKDVRFKKLKFYFEREQKIKFSLLNKPEYEIKGEIIEIPKRKFFSYTSDIIIKTNSGEIIINIYEINYDTILPIDYNPIRYFQRKNISEEQRKRIFQRDNYTCQYNLDGCFINKELEIDHIIPVVKGGENFDFNLITCCSNCNRKKGTKIIMPKNE